MHWESRNWAVITRLDQGIELHMCKMPHWQGTKPRALRGPVLWKEACFRRSWSPRAGRSDQKSRYRLRMEKASFRKIYSPRWRDHQYEMPNPNLQKDRHRSNHLYWIRYGFTTEMGGAVWNRYLSQSSAYGVLWAPAWEYRSPAAVRRHHAHAFHYHCGRYLWQWSGGYVWNLPFWPNNEDAVGLEKQIRPWEDISIEWKVGQSTKEEARDW